MPVDPKTARHECSVIKRQVMGCYPRLHIQYILHGENERKKVFATESRQFTNHPTGKYLLEYPDKEAFKGILKKNQSKFVCIAKQNKPGFLGFFKQKSYMALCFVNYDRFENIDTLRNHAFNLAWHAIALQNDYEAENSGGKKDKKPIKFKDENNILIPDLTIQEYCHRNLQGDIFSTCIQTILGRKEVFSKLTEQRIKATLTATKGFAAENFPFALCVDTLEYVLKNNIEQYKKSKRPILSAVEITQDIGKTYESASIEKWRSFAIPSQQMAWTGYDFQTILGAALYTGENTYAQSISDMISERMSINPKMVASLQDYNPFTNQEANARMHKKLCLDLLYNLLARLVSPEDHTTVIEVIEKQNLALMDGKVMGWCVPALVPIEELIRECPDKSMMPDLTNQAMKMFEKEVDQISWETLVYLNNVIFKQRRNYDSITLQDLLNITEEDEELSSVHYGLTLAAKFKIS